MAEKELKIEVYGVYFDVKGWHTKGESQTHDYCGSPDDFEIDSISIDDADLQEVLNDYVLDIIKEKALISVSEF